mgnify:CR=1 FL=1
MNPEREVKLSNVRIYFDGKEIGELKDVSARVEIEHTNKSESYFNYSKSFEITLENIHSELTIVEELLHIKQVLKYVKHSKKKASAVKKYFKLVEKINKH